MNRKGKNFICILIIIILLLSIVFTIYLAKTKLSTSNIISSSMLNLKEENTPPEKPEGDLAPEIKDGESMENPPEMNDGESMETPPEKPDGENDGETPPEKPEGDNTSENEVNGTIKENNINEEDIVSNTESVSLTIPYYIAFAVETFVLAFIIIYLIQSKFNSYDFIEVYTSFSKVLICILLSGLISSLLTFGISYITNNYILNSSDSNVKNSSFDENKGNNTTSSATYSSSNEITTSTSISNLIYESNNADENALLVSGDITVIGEDLTINKTGDSDGGDNTSFYGINSAVIAKNGATLNLNNINVYTNAVGANGVFSYGGSATTNNSSSDGTTINITNSTITTTKDNSGGIMTTGGGVTNATNLTVTTEGVSSAAIRTDRGGGVVSVDGGTYKTTGNGSPAIYSTANISVKNATLESTTSEGIIIEGKNSVSIESVKLTDSNTKLNGQSTTYKNIFLYQSMSGDASDGLSEFSATNSNIITNNGDTFYVTNTSCEINLTNNTITNNDSTGNFLRAKSDSWGKSGDNGGEVSLNMTNQIVTGNIVIDSVSTLDMNLTTSNYTGTINGDNTAKNISIKLDKSSTIKLTGNSYISSLDNADSTNSNIDFNGYTLYVNGKSIN